MATMQSWKFPSKSNPDADPYTTRILADGRLGCDCRGWVVARPDPKNPKVNQPRYCTHCRQVVEQKLKCGVRFAGEYAYVVLKDAPPAAKTSTVVVEPAPAGLAGFVAPQLAAPMDAALDTREKRLAAIAQYPAARWAMEEKFDGHRVVVDRTATAVHAWSRPSAGKVGPPATRVLPKHVADGLRKLPVGTYDGELIVPGAGNNFGSVTDLANAGKEQYVVFDVLRLLGRSTTGEPYDVRRSYLTEIFRRKASQSPAVRLAESWAPSAKRVLAVWARGGEGCILKNRAATYRPGSRTDAFVKVKKVATAVVTITGFTAGKLGPFSTVNIRDAKGVVTTVKTLNNAELRRAAANPEALKGRQLRIEYTSRTADGAYLNPRWDRLEDAPVSRGAALLQRVTAESRARTGAPIIVNVPPKVAQQRTKRGLTLTVKKRA